MSAYDLDELSALMAEQGVAESRDRWLRPATGFIEDDVDVAREYLLAREEMEINGDRAAGDLNQWASLRNLLAGHRGIPVLWEDLPRLMDQSEALDRIYPLLSLTTQTALLAELFKHLQAVSQHFPHVALGYARAMRTEPENAVLTIANRCFAPFCLDGPEVIAEANDTRNYWDNQFVRNVWGVGYGLDPDDIERFMSRHGIQRPGVGQTFLLPNGETCTFPARATRDPEEALLTAMIIRRTAHLFVTAMVNESEAPGQHGFEVNEIDANHSRVKALGYMLAADAFAGHAIRLLRKYGRRA